MHGRYATGARFTLEVAGGRTGETPYHLDLVGEKQSLRLDDGVPRNLQSGRTGLIPVGERQAVDEGLFATLSDAAINVVGAPWPQRAFHASSVAIFGSDRTRSSRTIRDANDPMAPNAVCG